MLLNLRTSLAFTIVDFSKLLEYCLKNIPKNSIEEFYCALLLYITVFIMWTEMQGRTLSGSGIFFIYLLCIPTNINQTPVGLF